MATTTMPTTTMPTTLRAALIDLSGTVHIEDQILPGAREGIELLRKNGVPIKFVTNTTKESRYSLLRRLRGLGLEISDDEILTSLTAAKIRVEQEKLRPLFFLESSALEEFDEVSTSGFDSVVVGLAPHRFNHEALSEAMNVLLDGGKLIAIHKGRYYKAKDGTLKAGPGCFVSGLEFSAGVRAEVVGKPEPGFFQTAIDALNDTRSSSSDSSSFIKPEGVVMIGDDVNDDVAGAKKIGCKGVLVRTGKYRRGDENKASPSPDATCDNLEEAARLILSGDL